MFPGFASRLSGTDSTVSDDRGGENLSGREPVSDAPWMSSYPSFVDPELAPLPAPHLPGLIRQACATYADDTAFTQVMPNGMNGKTDLPAGR